MKKIKQLTNTTALKVAFIPGTNTTSDRFRITQLNNAKSVFISGNLDGEITNLIPAVLDKIDLIASYSLCVDNTQNKYFLFNIDFIGNSFENILFHFKNL